MDNLENPDFWCEGHGLRLIHRAVLASTDVFRAFLEKKPILNIPDREGRTALVLASKSNTSLLANIKLLVGAGADLNLQSVWGNTALIWAAREGDSEIAQALINAGADPDLQNERGYTALIWAARGGHLEIAQALINAGADLNLQNEWGDTALIEAARKGNKTLVSLLLISGSDTGDQEL